MTAALVLLALVAAQRLAELALAGRNTRRLLARGGVESGAGHYPLIVVLHAAWLGGLFGLGWDRPLQPAWVALFLALQLVRVWVIATLGERWTTRIITLPGAPLVRRGPYRVLRHPNYAVVSAEIAVLPLALGLPLYAAVFFVLNLLALRIRIRAESQALAQASAGSSAADEGLAPVRHK